MLRYSVLLALCLCMYTGMAQDVFSFTQGKPEQKRYYEEIPYEKVGGKIIVTVEIDLRQIESLPQTTAGPADSDND